MVLDKFDKFGFANDLACYGYKSNILVETFGIPQGSMLGPL